jgi:hypothetical protein
MAFDKIKTMMRVQIGSKRDKLIAASTHHSSF